MAGDTVARRGKRSSAQETAVDAARFIAVLGSMRRGLEGVAEEARRDISSHSFRGYHRFRAKLTEHAALLTMTRARLGDKPPPELLPRLEEEEIRAAEVQIRATLSFIFALSAIPNLPLGARETFIDELHSLAAAKTLLSRPDPAVPLSEGVLDDLEMAQAVLEEVAARAPKLLDLGEDAVEPVAA